jgi:hypothetical protein
MRRRKNLGGLGAGFFTGGATSDDNEIVRIVPGHKNLFLSHTTRTGRDSRYDFCAATAI